MFPTSAAMQTDFGSAEQTLLGQCQLWEAQGTGLQHVGEAEGRNSILQIHGEVGNVSLAQAHSRAVFGGSRNSPINPGSAAV